MLEFLAAAAGALWLGLLNSVSPCPLTTNIAAVSYIGRKADGPKKAALAGAIYALGRMSAYVGVAAVAVKISESIPSIATFFQTDFNAYVGPIMIVVGILLLGVLPMSFGGLSVSQKAQKTFEGMGTLGAFAIGVIFALSFCPISAVIFFGSLLPMCLKMNSAVFLPGVFGLGTALPVIAAALILSFAANKISGFYNAAKKVERIARVFTAVLFIGLGIYYTL